MCKAFYYKNYSFNTKTGELLLTYECNNHSFVEKITFPNAPFTLSTVQQQALDRIFFLTHIAFGISYYKAFCAPVIKIESGKLTPAQGLFFEQFFVSGLGEFAVRNNLNLQGKICFPTHAAPVLTEPLFPYLNNKLLVPVGGGKDSCVSLELLKKAGYSCQSISVGSARPIEECIAVAGSTPLTIKRQIAPTLLNLNQSGKVLNGHVPITGMLAFVLWAAAVLYGFKYVALSCEASADSGNLMQGKLAINHQYSKSYAFEAAFKQITQTVTPEFLYFSLLRPLTEAAIARLFARHCSNYFTVFTSCNKAFKLDQNKRLDRWCGSCDKCRFVFLILAPFMDKNTLVQAVGNNPLNDMAQLDGYKELLGLSGHKPFECVGETQECRFAFHTLLNQAEWQTDAVLQALKQQVPMVENNLFTPRATHQIPKEIYHAVEKYFA